MRSPPPSTAIQHTHLTTLGTAADGWLFRNLLGGDLAESTVGRVWDGARKATSEPSAGGLTAETGGRRGSRQPDSRTTPDAAGPDKSGPCPDSAWSGAVFCR